MAYGTPTDPVAGTVITVAYAVANVLNPIRWLRTLTGGADPPGTGYMVTSDSTTATSWKNGVAPILAVLGYTPVNKAGDTMSGNLLFSDNQEGVHFSGTGGIGRTRVQDYSGQGWVAFCHNDSVEFYDSVGVRVAFFQALYSGGVASALVGGQTVWHDGNVALRVATAAIQALAVTRPKIALLAVDNPQMAAGAAAANLGFTPARIVTGTYTGDGTANRTITTTGITPVFVEIRKASNSSRYQIDSTTNAVHLNIVTGTVDISIAKLASGGFIVNASDGANENAVSFAYVAYG